MNVFRWLRRHTAGPLIPHADLEALIDATREHHGLRRRYSDTELEALARDAARRSGCPLCQVTDEETP